MHRRNTVNLGMCLSKLLMESLSDDPVVVHQYSADHRVGSNPSCAGFRKFQASHHKPFVNHQSMK
jgi:hypothetical protein